MIYLEGVSKQFGEVAALRDVDLHVDKGEVVLLTGPSGAGKSILAALLFARFQSQVRDGLPGFRHCIWLRPSQRTTWREHRTRRLTSIPADRRRHQQ